MNLITFILISTITITAFAVSLFTAKVYAIGLHASIKITKVLLIVGILGPLAFILTMFLGRSGKEWLVEWISYPVNAFGGIIFYLFITALLLGVVLFLGRILNFSIPIYISWVLLLLGFSLGLIGLFQASRIKIVSYTIPITGVSKDWNSRTALLVSDTHFGLVNHKKFSDKVVKKILEQDPDFVLHAGDFYDGPRNDTFVITESWRMLTDKVPVFYTPGNHEEYGDYAGFLTSIKDAGVKVLADDVTNYEDIQIGGITYRNKNQEEDARLALQRLNIDPKKPFILINHPPTFQKSALDIGTDIMLSGHTHRGQFWPLNYIVRTIYGKYIYGLNIDNTLITITTSGVGTAGPPMRLFNTPELVLIKFETK